MYHGSYVFAQVMELVPRRELTRFIMQYQGDSHGNRFPCRDQFLAMAFGQLSYRESLRDVASCLTSHQAKLYHLGFKHTVTKSTLARANEKRDWRIYRDLAQHLITEARTLYVDEPSIASDITSACYAIDSTSIDLCLSFFPWTPYANRRASVKLHVVMDIRGSIPTFFHITGSKVNDVNFLDDILFEAGAFYMIDRGYLDFERLYTIHQCGAFFVTRTRCNTLYARRYSNPVDRSTGVVCDQVIFLEGKKTREKYTDTLRRIKYRDSETGKVYNFITNNHTVSAASIALLYKHRWQVELFFRWIKQHLKIKVFWGHSENAVKTQICIALCTYLLVAILKKRLKIDRNIYEILQIVSISLFDKTGLVELFSKYPVQKRVKSFEKTARLFDD